MLQISKAINILHYHFRILKIHELFSPLRHTAIQRDVVWGSPDLQHGPERDDVTDTNQICMTANIKLDKYHERQVGTPGSGDNRVHYINLENWLLLVSQSYTR